MTAAALKARPLPNYTKKEEIMNSVSHGIGALIGVYVLITCFSASVGTVSKIGSLVYGISMILLYTMSCVYHGIRQDNVLTKQIFRIVDHCTIYVLIAGTYTPVILNIMYPDSPAKALAILAGIWAAAGLGITLTAIDLQKYSKFSMACYIALGWFALFIVKPIVNGAGMAGMMLLLGGGISYTVGAVIYGIGKKKRYMHFVFHIFVILGTLLHYMCIINYVIR